MRDELGNELNEILRNYSEEPRDELWSNINKSLKNDSDPKLKNGKISDAATGFSFLLFLFMVLPSEKTLFDKFSIKNPLLSKAASSVVNDVYDNKLSEESTTQLSLNSNDESETVSMKNENGKSSGDGDVFFSHIKAVARKQIELSKSKISGKKQKPNLYQDGGVDDLTETSESYITKINLADSTAKVDSLFIEELTVKENEVIRSIASVKKKNARKINFYFIAMPTFGYQRIVSNINDNVIVEGIKKIPTFSLDRLGIRAELGLEKSVLPRMKLFSGLVYYQRKQTIGYVEDVVDSTNAVIGPNGEIIISPEYKSVDRSFEYELKNLGIQLGLNYQLSKKKFLHTLGTGVEFHIALNKLSDKVEISETNNPSAYVFYNLYYRLQYPVEGKLRAVLQPTLNYAFYINQNFNAPFYVKPYGLGLNLGFTYNF